MIKANELRIGNLVLFINYDEDADGNIVGEKEIEIVNINTLRNAIEHPDWYDSIPLTPELLEQCGFKWNTDDGVYSNQVGNTLHLEINLEKGMVALTPETWNGGIPDSGMVWAWSKVLYVHQLQNLYFALTGHELEIKGKL